MSAHHIDPLFPIGAGVGITRVSLSPIGGEGRVRGQVREHLRRYARRLRRFRRQHPIGPFIADFCCTEAKLVIELDGGQHALRLRDDQLRAKYLESQGYVVIRFWDNDVLKAFFTASSKGLASGPLSPLTLPSPQRGEGFRGRA